MYLVAHRSSRRTNQEKKKQETLAELTGNKKRKTRVGGNLSLQKEKTFNPKVLSEGDHS